MRPEKPLAAGISQNGVWAGYGAMKATSLYRCAAPPQSFVIEGAKRTAVRRLIDNPGRAKGIGVRLRTAAPNYLTLDNMAKAMERWLDGLLDRWNDH